MSENLYRKELKQFIKYCLDRRIQDEQLFRLFRWKFSQELHRLEELIDESLDELIQESEASIAARAPLGSGR